MKRIGVKVLLVQDSRIAEIRGHMGAALAGHFEILDQADPSWLQPP